MSRACSSLGAQPLSWRRLLVEPGSGANESSTTVDPASVVVMRSLTAPQLTSWTSGNGGNQDNVPKCFPVPSA